MQDQLGALDQEQVLDPQLGKHPPVLAPGPDGASVRHRASCISFSRKRR